MQTPAMVPPSSEDWSKDEWTAFLFGTFAGRLEVVPNNERPSIVRWHENSARALEFMASERPVAERGDYLVRASFHRDCADKIINRADCAPPQGFEGHPFRDAWLKQQKEGMQ